MAAVARSATHRARSLSQSRSLQTTKPRQAIMMPYLSPLMTEGTISAWRKKEGDTFNAGDILVSIESDFHEVDVRAVSSGILSKILMPDGSQHVKVEEVIALVAQDASELAAIRAATGTKIPMTSSSSPPKTAVLSTLSPTSPRATFTSSRLEQPPRPLSPTTHRTHAPTPMASEPSTLQATAALHMKATATSASQPPRSNDDGSAIRRMMRDKFASHERKLTTATMLSSQGKKSGTTAYFDGIL